MSQVFGDIDRFRRERRWKAAYNYFLSRLRQAHIHALVVDYDGTLCDEAKRFAPLPKAIATELGRLLRAGIYLGVATGRGKSVREQLQNAIPSDLWDLVVVGYYNGSDIKLLSDEALPDGTDRVLEPLKPVEEMILHYESFLGIEVPEFRRNQITLKAAACMTIEQLWQRVQGLVTPSAFPGVAVLRSGHLVDILAPGVSRSWSSRKSGRWQDAEKQKFSALEIKAVGLEMTMCFAARRFRSARMLSQWTLTIAGTLRPQGSESRKQRSATCGSSSGLGAASNL